MSAGASWDALIVGGGHNGLVAAAYLARQGLSVKVLEARPILGGAAVTEEFHPGFRNSSCSYLVGMLSPRVIAELELERHGLRIVRRPASEFAPQPDGRYLLKGDGADFPAQLDAFHAGDGTAYEAFDADLDATVRLVRRVMEQRPPRLVAGRDSIAPVVGAVAEARHLSERQRALVLRLLTSSAANFLDRYFGGEAVKGMYAYLAAVGNLQSPHATGSAYVLLHHSFGESNGETGAWGHAIGGMGAVSDAIARSAAAAGAAFELNARVARILTRAGAACGVALEDGREYAAHTVVAGVNPKLLYQRLLDPSLLPAAVLEDIDHYRCLSGTLRINVALAELPDFKALPGREMGLHHQASVIIAPSIAHQEQAYDDAKNGGWAREPLIEMWISSTVDPTLAPEGRHVASLFCQHFHRRLSGGRDWDDHREEVADLVIRTIGEYAPNFPGAVLGRRVLTPKDLETEYGLVGGDIFHGALHLDQLFALRPVAGYADYRTPVPGVYLCGSGAHPGGGVTGVPGRSAAREILRDLRGRRLGRRRKSLTR